MESELALLSHLTEQENQLLKSETMQSTLFEHAIQVLVFMALE